MDRKLLDKLKARLDPELVKEYGDPFDPNDIRNIAPTKRRGFDPALSIEEEIRLLAQDIEVLMKMVSRLTLESMKQELLEHRGNPTSELLTQLFGDNAAPDSRPGGYL